MNGALYNILNSLIVVLDVVPDSDRSKKQDGGYVIQDRWDNSREETEDGDEGPYLPLSHLVGFQGTEIKETSLRKYRYNGHLYRI